MAHQTFARSTTGKLKPYGSLVIDVKIRAYPEFSGMNLRIKKASGIPVGKRDAEKTLREMKLMLKELEANRDASTLRRIQEGKLLIGSAFARWKQGRLHLADHYEDARIVKKWRSYLDSTSMADATRKHRKAMLSALLKHDLLDEKQVFNDLPDILKKTRKHYERVHRHTMFNKVRAELLTFLTKGLDLDPGSPLLREVRRIARLKALQSREHNPFVSPLSCIEFCTQVRKRGNDRGPLYAESVLFMCLHGMRPTEFSGRRFGIDPSTGHLRIHGTKNQNAKRVVPLFGALETPGSLPREETLNGLFKRMKSAVRCRDFRRTYSIWCAAANIPPSRVRAYMGHGESSVTQTYQKQIPKQPELDSDLKLLRSWMDRELQKPKVKPARPVAVTMESVLASAKASTVDPELGRLLQLIGREEAADAAHPESAIP